MRAKVQGQSPLTLRRHTDSSGGVKQDTSSHCTLIGGTVLTEGGPKVRVGWLASRLARPQRQALPHARVDEAQLQLLDAQSLGLRSPRAPPPHTHLARPQCQALPHACIDEAQLQLLDAQSLGLRTRILLAAVPTPPPVGADCGAAPL